MWPPTTGATSSSINNLVTKQTEPLATWKKYSYSRIFKETGLYFHNFFSYLKPKLLLNLLLKCLLFMIVVLAKNIVISSMVIYSSFVLYFSNMVNVKFYICLLDDYNIARAAMLKAELSSCLESDDNLLGKRKSK